MAVEKLPPVLVADDDPDVIAWLERRIADWGYRVVSAQNKGEVLSRLRAERPMLVLLDRQFGETDGSELLNQLLSTDPTLRVAVLTGHGSIDNVRWSLLRGAFDYLTKPPDPQRLWDVLTRAANAVVTERGGEKAPTPTRPISTGLIGESPMMQGVIQRIRTVAKTDVTVLILGESGTGKEVVARTLHAESPRKAAPFVPLNMAAVPRELAESLLFGHEKGAFTGADKAQAGACELADKGTIFLDEIGEMELGLQAKLLRFLQEKVIQRVGNPTLKPVDVRVIAATNRDLLDRVKAGEFREDLYYRLNVVPILVPPLRDRGSDIALLANWFLDRAKSKYGRITLHFTPEALQFLTQQPWPGNVRQLENLIERIAILSATEEISPDDLAHELGVSRSSSPPMVSVSVPAGGDDLRQIDMIERQAILDALRQFRGSVREASHKLGLSQATIYRKIKRYQIDLADFARPSGTS